MERVRTTAMAMKDLSNMLEVCEIISHELASLGVKEIRNIQTAIFYEAKGAYMNYEYYAKHNKTFITEVNYNDHPVAKEFASKMLKGTNEVFAHGFKGQEVKNWLTYQKTTNVFIDTNLETAESLNYYWYSLGPVALGMSTYTPLNEAELELFKRFRNVFELAYRRFIDIEKALEQAREAQIEVALERVRARTMAMHHSNELNEAAELLYSELTRLGIIKFTCGYVLIDPKTDTGYSYMANPEGSFVFEPLRISQTDSPVFRSFYDSWKKQEPFATIELRGQANIDHNRYLTEKVENFPLTTEQMLSILPPQTISNTFNFKQGYLIVVSLDRFTPQQYELMIRFTKVFEQTYTRFLDLQKAEAQAREAQIEAALERVRSRSMAMHKSDELPEAANLLFRQIESLGIHVFSTGYNIWQEDKKAVTSWMSSQGLIQRPFKLPLTEEPALIECYEAASRGDTFYVQELSGDKTHCHILSYMRTLPVVGELMGQMSQAGIPLPHRMINHHVFFLQGYLMFITYDPVPDAHEIFRRFAKVFEQTYTRFLDLQKAEAQTREAQIEAALERVRSRSMAMHKSDELLEVVASVFQQMQLLGFNLNLCNIVLFDSKTLGADYWVSGSKQAVLPESYHGPYADHPFYHYQLNTWKNKEPFALFELSGEIKKSWDEILFTKTDLKRLPDATKEMMQQLDKVIISSVATKHGLVQAIGTEQLSSDDVSILSRFAKVFDQTYTRFLDLQKAEAQAREAQNEAALERVRSRDNGYAKK